MSLQVPADYWHPRGGGTGGESSLAEESLDLGPGLGGTMGRSPWPGVEARIIGIVSTISVKV